MNAPRVAAAFGGLFFLAAGTWAFVDQSSFFEVVAPFPPLNVHFLRDAGAFQIGLGAALLLAMWRSDALFVALAAVGIGSAFHVVAHVIDIDRGGEPVRDLVSLSALTAILLVGAAIRGRQVRR